MSGEDRLAAVARDPYTAFVYWRLTGLRSRRAAEELGPEAQWVLRVVEVESGESFTVPVDPAARNHYLRLRPGRTYGFELALRRQDKWRSICRSERLVMPKAPPEPSQAEPAAPEPPGLRIETTPIDHGSSFNGRQPER